MKSISIKNPWAYLICAGIKDIENRTWKTKFRGRVLIHASGKLVYPIFTKEQESKLMLHSIIGDIDFSMVTSAIIGSVEIVDCVLNHNSIWAEKTEGVTDSNTHEFIPNHTPKPVYNWVLKNPIMFETPIYGVKGKLSFWDYNEEITVK